MNSDFFNMGGDVMLHPSFETAFKKVERLHRRHLETGSGQGLLLTGLSGAGKDTLIEYYKNLHPDVPLEDRTIRKIVSLDTPSAPTVKILVQAMQYQLAENAVTGSAEFQTQRIFRLVKERGVELIFFNELQHFVDRKHEDEMRRATDWIKNFSSTTKIPFVLVGLPRTRRLLEVNEQLRRRCSAGYYIKEFGFETPEEKKLFRGVLRSLREQFPLPCIPLEEEKMAERFHYATNGQFGYINRLSQGAVEAAYMNQDAEIRQEHYYQGFREEVWNEAPDELNPFSDKFVKRKLDQMGEPFAPTDEFYMRKFNIKGKGLTL